MACVWDLACNIIGNLTHYQLVPGNILEFWQMGHEVRVQMIMRSQLWFFDDGCTILCKYSRLKLTLFRPFMLPDLFTEESDSEEEVTDDSPKGSSDDFWRIFLIH